MDILIDLLKLLLILAAVAIAALVALYCVGALVFGLIYGLPALLLRATIH